MPNQGTAAKKKTNKAKKRGRDKRGSGGKRRGDGENNTPTPIRHPKSQKTGKKKKNFQNNQPNTVPTVSPGKKKLAEGSRRSIMPKTSCLQKPSPKEYSAKEKKESKKEHGRWGKKRKNAKKGRSTQDFKKPGVQNAKRLERKRRGKKKGG